MKITAMRLILLVALMVLVSSDALAQNKHRQSTSTTYPSTRDWRTWPFTPTSPWNYPIGSGAQYAEIPGLTGLFAGLNWNDRWTSAVVIASDSDPLATLLYSAYSGSSSAWSFLASGGKNCGNSRTDESILVNGATTTVRDGNVYSTIAIPDSMWQLPPSYHKGSQDYQSYIRLPAGACASPDTDGLMAVFQPNGWVLDSYATVVTSGNKVVSWVASFIDAKGGDGTGWWNGRRASMLPSFAGLIRTGEISRGLIPHALVASVAKTILTPQAVWPAYAFDRNSGYTGTVPMGALLAIPASVDIDSLGLTPQGIVLARAAQNYGVYIGDRNGGGFLFLAELNNPEIRWSGWSKDVNIIKNQLKRVANNSQTTPGGGGIPRAPLAPLFK